MLRWIGAIILVATPAFAGDALTGPVKVLDGDTLELQGRLVDLYGIDAPEAEQVCAMADESRYRCGEKAAAALRERIGTTSVSCLPQGGTTQDRLTAVCHLGETDLSAWMVVHGHAIALRDGTGGYLAKQTHAWGRRVGLWAGVFDEPASWRRARLRAEPATGVKP
ncbi:thermonuclease family protein [Methylorubrum extorquens]|nr:thermonuclease family protein [Methylorubrum extorquens]